MLNKTFPKFLFSTLLLLFLAGISMVSAAQPETEQPDSLTITLTTPSYTITNDGTFDFIDLPEFGYDGEIGNPQLPEKIYNIVLPPQVDPFRVELTITSAVTTELPSEYEIAAVPPAVTWSDDQQMIDWGPYVESITDGRNQDVYGANQYFPASPADIWQHSQMRKWRFVQLRYRPFQYNPVTKKLLLTTELEVTVSYALQSALQPTEVSGLTDTVMDDQAAAMFYNFDDARHWYETTAAPPETQTNPTYVIITTNRIATNSTMLDDFISHTAAKGYDVELITQNEYGSLTGQAPNGTAEKVRQWLIQNYISKQIEYVLLIGNPNPDDPSNPTDAVGDLPMKMMWPRFSQTTYRESPTDYFFADLTGNWDLDGDGYFGEYEHDKGIGGVDFTPEVYVGRIPVYAELFDQDIPKLDAILQKIISYDNELYPGWRHSALLPMSFSDSYTDGAYLAEAMKVNYLSHLGYNDYTLYQQNLACANSIFDSDEPLINNAVVNHWSGNSYGLVLWWGHGSSTSAAIGYTDDSNNCTEGTLFNTSQTTSLNNSRPAIAYLNSCTNGYPESSSNLGYNLLRFGTVGTVSASRVSWYNLGQWNPNRVDNAGLGYRYMEHIAQGDNTGQALYTVKANINSLSSVWWMNLMDFNLYGDPLTRISQGGIHGYVRDTAGVGIADAMIQVEGYPPVYTDSNGYFEQFPIVYGNRAVRISKVGYTFTPNYSQRNFWNYPLDHNAIGYEFTPTAVPFFDGFETATLSPAWALESNLEGRVQLSTAYPYEGSKSLLLDDSTDGGYFSSAAAILAIDLAGIEDAELSFWWRSFDDEPHPEDGVTMSANNGQSWIPLYQFDNSISANNFVETIIDLDEAAVNAGLTLNDHMLIKFRFYDNYAIPSDGYAIDNVSVIAREPEINVATTPIEQTAVLGDIYTTTFTITNSGNYTLTYAIFDRPLTTTAAADSGGPDSFGYTFYDSSEANGPTYRWIEIAPPAGGKGLPVHLTGTDDNYIWPIALPFPFEFYGQTYNNLALSANGVLYFQNDGFPLVNQPIPSTLAADVQSYIAPLWDDLVVIPGEVYTQQIGDRFVIEYYQLSRYGLSADHATWQVILLANGSILFQYKDVDFADPAGDGGLSATVGIQGDETTGLQYSYDTAALTNDLAICFAYPGTASHCANDVAWLTTMPEEGHLGSGAAQEITVTFDTTLLDHTAAGENRAQLQIITNDPDQLLVEIPVEMTLIAYGVEATSDTAAQFDDPGATVTYTMQLTNTGSVTDTFTITPAGHNWPLTISTTVGLLAAGANTSTAIAVHIPDTITVTTSDTLSVTITSQTDDRFTAELAVETTAVVTRDFTLTPLDTVVYGVPGSTIVHTLMVNNFGNVSESCDITTQGGQWNITAPDSAGPLPSGQIGYVDIMITIPPNTAEGTEDFVTIIFTSQADSTASATADLKTVVQFNHVYLPLTIR